MFLGLLMVAAVCLYYITVFLFNNLSEELFQYLLQVFTVFVLSWLNHSFLFCNLDMSLDFSITYWLHVFGALQSLGQLLVLLPSLTLLLLGVWTSLFEVLEIRPPLWASLSCFIWFFW